MLAKVEERLQVPLGVFRYHAAFVNYFETTKFALLQFLAEIKRFVRIEGSISIFRLYGTYQRHLLNFLFLRYSFEEIRFPSLKGNIYGHFFGPVGQISFLKERRSFGSMRLFRKSSIRSAGTPLFSWLGKKTFFPKKIFKKLVFLMFLIS